MFEVIRKFQYSWTIRALLLLLGGLMTVFFGSVGAYLARVKPIATIDCRSFLFLQLPGCQQILADDIDRESNNIRNAIANRYGKEAPAVLNGMNVRASAVERLIMTRLVENEAQRLGLTISDDQLEKTIGSQEAFQTDGQFDVRRYRAILAENNLEPSVYENETREAMLSDAMQSMVTATVAISNEDARRAYDDFAGKIDFAYIKVPYSRYEAGIAPSDQEIAKFFTDHKELFREPEQIKIAFVRYNPIALSGSYAASEPEIQDYYEQNLKTEFTHPAQARARHILIGVTPGASAEEKAAAQAKAVAILAKVKADGDFVALAKQNSEDPGTKDKGGELGFFGRGELVKPFEEVAFALKPGEYGMAESEYGFHVIQVEESKPAHIDTPEEARPKVIAALQRKNGVEFAKNYLQQDLTATLTGHSIDEVARKRGLSAVETPFVTANEPIRGAEDYPQFSAEVFKLKDGEVRALTEGPEPYLVKLIAREPSRIPTLDQSKDLARKAFIRIEAEKKAREAAQAMLQQIKSPADLAAVAEQNHRLVAQTGDFPKASHAVPGIGEVPGLTLAADAVTKLPGVISQVMENDGNSYIFELASRTPPDPADWKIQGPAFTDRLLQQRRAATWIDFVNGLKSEADIVIHTDLIGTTPS